MKEKIKIKSKQNYRSISNRDTPINMQKLKKKYINEQMIKLIKPKYRDYTKNTHDEVNYAEEHVESYATSVVKYSADILSANLSKRQQDNSSPIRNVKQNHVKAQLFKVRTASNLIPNNRIEHYKNQRIRLRQNFETQKIYQKVYFIKKQMKYVKSNKKAIKKQEYESNTPIFYTYRTQEYKTFFVEQESTRSQESSFIKQKEQNNLKDIKSKAPSFIKQRNITHNKIDEQQINQVRMKDNYKKKEVASKEYEQLMELQKSEYEEMWAKLLAEG